MKPSKNLIVGVASSVWAALVALAVVPFYLRYLGIESYGLIGFFATAQATIALLDMGLSATINREVARHLARGTLDRAGTLLRTLSAVYWGTAGVLVVVALLAAPHIAAGWLNSRSLSIETLSRSVVLLGLVIACRWPIGLYQGVLFGAHRLILTSAVSVVMTTLGSLGAVVVLARVSPTIEAFFAWQACVGIAYALTVRHLAWRVLGVKERLRFDLAELRRIWAFTAGMSGVAISGMLLLQGDKLILSKLLSLEAFGHYVLATVVASGLYLILTPTFNLIFPRLSALFLKADSTELVDYYRHGTRLLACALFPIATVSIVFATDLLRLWTREPALAESAAPIVRLYLIGTTLNGVMHFPYALQLASGKTGTPVMINFCLLVLMLPLTTFLTIAYGAIGGAAAWAILNVFYVLVGTWLTHRVLLTGIGARWLVNDVGLPLVSTVVVVGTVSIWLSGLPLPRPLLLGLAAAFAGGFCFLAMFAERIYGKRVTALSAM